MRSQVFFLSLCAALTNGFVVKLPQQATTRATVSCRAEIDAVDLETIADIGYAVSVSKPLGVVFGENNDPYNGLSVDDVEGGLNGGKAGLRVGDQLLAINGQSMIGSDFDSTMDVLKNSPSPMDMIMYRGTISSLYTIIMNRRGEAGVEEEEAEEIVMDENYESPVVMSLDDYEDDTISISEVAKDAVKGIGGMFNVGKMFSGKQETIQLEGDDGK